MSWHYQATHRTVRTQGTGGASRAHVFEVREVHDFDFDGKPSWTEDAIAPASETKDGLIEVLQMMLADVKVFDVLEVRE